MAVSLRCAAVSPSERPREVELGQVRRLRHRVQGERLGEFAVAEFARPPERVQYLWMAQAQTLSREAATRLKTAPGLRREKGSGMTAL